MNPAVQFLVLGLSLILGAVITWILRSTQVATLSARLDAAARRQSDADAELVALRSEHHLLLERYRDESNRRSVAEATAGTIPELQQSIATLNVNLATAQTDARAIAERKATLEAERDADRAALSEARDQTARSQEQLERLRTAVTQLTAERADLATRLDAERVQSQEKLGILNDAKQALSETFRALSGDALKSNNQAFIDLAKTTLERFQESAKGDLDARQQAVDQLVEPLRQSLSRVDTKLGEIERDRLSSYASLNEQLRGLVETHLPVLRSETANLVKALRQPTARGRWGELQLRRVVEMAGMLDYCDFVEQENRDTEVGRLRPDMIIRLPGGRNIVIDAKTPIAAYLEASEATDEITQRARLTQHAQQVRSHITALGRKGYWDQFSPSPEFVVMFIPGEAFFSAALQEDPSLIELGVQEKVIPATPTTLIALLRTIAYGWRQEKLAENAEEVARLGKELYDRITKVGEHWSDVGDRLGKAVEAYNKSTVSLESRVLVSARRFRELKVGSDDSEIPPLQQIDKIPRALQAAELMVNKQDLEIKVDHLLVGANDDAAGNNGSSIASTGSDSG